MEYNVNEKTYYLSESNRFSSVYRPSEKYIRFTETRYLSVDFADSCFGSRYHSWTANRGSRVDVYIGHSSFGNTFRIAGIGICFPASKKHEAWYVGEPMSGFPYTSNRALLEAAIEAVRIAQKRGIKRLRLFTSSEYLHLGITQYIRYWKGNGWTTVDGDNVENPDLWMQLDEVRRGYSVIFLLCYKQGWHRSSLSKVFKTSKLFVPVCALTALVLNYVITSFCVLD